MIRVVVFTGESPNSQAEADDKAGMAFNAFLGQSPRVTINGQPTVSTNMIVTPSEAYWHTCTIVAVILLPKSSREYP